MNKSGPNLQGRKPPPQTTGRSAMACITRFSARPRPGGDGGRLAKSFDLIDGEIRKTSAAQLSEGAAQVIPARTAQELSDALRNLTIYQAVSVGILADGRDTAPVASLAAIESGRAPARAVSRSLDCFTFPSGPGWLLIDYDSRGAPDDVRQRIADLGGPDEALWSIWPEGKRAAWLVRASSSDGVSAEGVEAIRSDGMHVYVLIDDVSRSREALEALFARAWRAGLGWIMLGATGATLKRGLVDLTVASPERLIFEAAPVLGPNVARKTTVPTFHEGPPAAIPTDDGDLFAAAENLQSDAIRAIRPEAEKAQAAWLDDRAERDAPKFGGDREKAREAAERVLRGHGGTLADDDVLEVGSGRFERVGDILDNPDAWHRRGIPDPVEGAEYGLTTATLLLKPRPDRPEEKPLLVSHAHGARTVWRFQRHENPIADVFPFFPAADGSATDAAGRVQSEIAAWARETFLRARTSKEVATRYKAMIGEGQDGKLTASQRMAIRREVQAEWGVDFLPASRIGERTETPGVAISGAQGIGKTAALVGRDGRPGALHSMRGLVGAVYLPDFAMIEEAAQEYARNRRNAADAPSWLIWRGRGRDDPKAPGEAMCRLPKLAEKIGREGGNVKTALCAGCEFADVCGYLRQEAAFLNALEDPKGRVIFAPHDTAALPFPRDKVVDYSVFDERPRQLHREDFVTLDDLGDTLKFDAAPHAMTAAGQAAAQADALANQLRFIRPVMIALRDAAQDAPAAMLAAIRAKGVTVDMVKGALAGLEAFADHATKEAVQRARDAATFAVFNGKPVDLEGRIDRAIAETLGKPTPRLRRIFEILARELATDSESATALVAKKDSKGRMGVAGLTPFAVRRQNAPILYLDGTAHLDGNPFDPDAPATPKGAAVMFGRDLRPVVVRAERNAFVTMISDASFSNAAITGKGRTGQWAARSDAMRGALKEFISRQPGAAVMAGMGVRESLGLGDEGRAGHFNALRGRNAWEGRDVIVIGRNRPSVTALEEIARAYASVAGEAFTPLPAKANFPTEIRGLRMAGGGVHKVEAETHPDPWARWALAQICDGEAVQALDRARLYFGDRRQVFIFASLALDVTVNRVWTWKEAQEGGSKIERALAADGVLPLAGWAAFLLRQNLWGTQRTAERVLNPLAHKVNSLERHLVNNIYLFTECRSKPLSLISVTPANFAGRQRQRAVLTLAATSDPAEARRLAEAAFGELRAFEFLRVIAEGEAVNAPATVETEAPAPQLTPDEQARFDEVAARLEFEEGHTRREAERRAMWAIRSPEPERAKSPTVNPPIISIEKERARRAGGAGMA